MTARRLQHRLATEQADRRLPSIVAGIVRDGRLLWSGAAGDLSTSPDHAPPDHEPPDHEPPDHEPGDDTQYRIGSITKTLVAVAVLRLVDEGRIHLDDPVTRHLDDAPTGTATVAQLLSHGAGLSAETAAPWWERAEGVAWPQLLERLNAHALPPGRRFHYSNVGYAVLGELLARLRGASWHEVVHRELLAPLGMHRTTTRPHPPAASGYAVHPWADIVLAEPEHDAVAMAPAGQLWSTVTDLARWAAFLGGETAGLLSNELTEQLARPLVVDDRPGQPWTAAHGLGVQIWNRDGVRTIGHGGSMPGFLASVEVEPGGGDGVVLATNTTSGLSATIVADLFAIVRELEPQPVTPWRPAATSTLDLVGPWYWGPAPLVLRATADGLELEPVPGGAGRSSRFVPGEVADTWVGTDGYYAGEVLRVVRGDDRAPRWLDLASFVFTRTPYDPSADVPGGVDEAGWGPTS
ncbi:beta-lactamase family protein [Nitriliruptoraceae bacterium ZYF776]|nr:beta-lactamase family protein [Profundirhabdus halotolerans]